MQRGQIAPMCLADWESWTLKRICRSSLATEAQSRSDVLDALEFELLFLLEVKSSSGLGTADFVDRALQQSLVFFVTDFKCLYDELERIETSGLNSTEKRTSIVAIRQRVRQLDLKNLSGSIPTDNWPTLSRQTKFQDPIRAMETAR